MIINGLPEKFWVVLEPVNEYQTLERICFETTWSQLFYRLKVDPLQKIAMLSKGPMAAHAKAQELLDDLKPSGVKGGYLAAHYRTQDD
jgi:hypothetical protein